MPRTALTVQAPVSLLPYPTLPIGAGAAAFTMAAADNVNGNSFPHTGREIIIARNKDAGAQTVTLTSVANPADNRTGDITTYSLPIGSVTPTYAIFGPFPVNGWRQSDGNFYLTASSANIEFAIIRIPQV